MNIQQQQRIKSELKEELIKYYDEIQFQIDIDTQEELEKLDEISKKELLIENEKLISIVKYALDINIKKVNEYKFEIDMIVQDEKEFKNYIKKNILNIFCYYWNYDKLVPYISDKKLLHLGLLLETNWDLDENQLNYLGSTLHRDQGDFYLNSEIILLSYGISSFNEPSDFMCSYKKLTKQAIEEDLRNVEDFKLMLDFSYIQDNPFHKMVNLKSLTFICNNELSLTYGMFQKLERLESLYIYCFELIDIESDAFKCLVNLKDLSIEASFMQTIKINVFTPLKNLESLFINSQSFYEREGNGNCELEDGAFENLLNLKKLKISVWQDISDKLLAKMTKLEVLDIYGCSFGDKIKPNAFKDLKNLKDVTYYRDSYFWDSIEVESSEWLGDKLNNKDYLGLQNTQEINFRFFENPHRFDLQ